MLKTRHLRSFRHYHCQISHLYTSSVLSASRKVLQKFKLADIGEGITECEVIRWNVKPPGVVQAFDQLCEVQSDKASVEITSPFDGVVKELLVQEGGIAKVGDGLCLIEVDEETLDETSQELVEPAASTPEQSAAPKRRLHPRDPSHPQDAATILSSFSINVLAKPATRYFAREKGVDLTKLAPGSGRDGRIEKEDVENYLLLEEGKGSAAADTVRPDDSGDVVVELGRTRYGMWKAMEKSLEIPHFGYSTSLDITNLHNLLPILNAHIPPHYQTSPSPPLYLSVNPSAIYPAPAPPSVPPFKQYAKLTYLPVLLKTLAKAMSEWPIFRSSITPQPADSANANANGNVNVAKPTLTVRPHADISIALSTPTGLYTPTIQRADTHSIYALASQLKHLAHLGRQTPCGLSPKEMPKRGGTVTVSNIGAIGAGEGAAPVLVPGGGVAIVVLGRARWVWDVDSDRAADGRGERRLKVGVSWSADHRVVEGAELAAFVECWRAWVETPERLIGEAV